MSGALQRTCSSRGPRLTSRPTAVLQILLLTAAMAVSLAVMAVKPAPSSAYVSVWYTCRLDPNTWCRLAERHSYSEVSSGQYDWWTDTTTDSGWWCSKMWNEDNNTDYGRVCDWGRWTTANINPPSSHMHAMSANGNNCCPQDLRGYARTP